ncbi:transposon Tf2-8 polyprotein [Trichonephila clavipes]|nr:transposon Tf2-8 polyprotein [Trichonephila clavipes]
MQMTLADGRTQTTEILTTSVDISIQGKVIPTELLILKNARGNRTLLGIDFLTAAGIVLDLQKENNGVLYRYVPDADSAEAQLVIPTAERELIMERHHNDPIAGHYGEEGTFQKIARRYYWTGMRKYISDYIKKCPECARFKATNQKPAGLLRELQSIHRVTSARQCATTLIEEVFMRHGIPRRIISDNGTQFVSAVLQQICFTLNISQNFIPVYSPQSNPVERKTETLNPDLQYLLETIILVGIPNSQSYVLP